MMNAAEISAGLLSEGGRQPVPKAMASLRSAPAIQISRGTSVMLPGAFGAADFRADLQSLAAVLSQPNVGLSAEVWHHDRCDPASLILAAVLFPLVAFTHRATQNHKSFVLY